MNNQSPNDPQLESLAARLSSLAPKLSDDERRELLYACAFAAGAESSKRTVLRWRMVSTVLAVSLCGVLFSTVRRVAWSENPATNQNPIAQSSTSSVVADAPPAATTDAPPEFVRKRDNISLDAWANRSDPIERFSAALARFQDLDVSAQSQSVQEIRRSL
jgi:hypothetical protein